jgi:CubicO group peptidase (beta-lactamase class C family)
MLVKPEEVGLSSGRLGRISDHLRRYVDAGKLAGTLTLVARRGKIAYCEPLGHLEVERKRPVAPDSIFRIYSMTKPIASVGLMMLWEQGRFQLDDPVHKFIPSWRDQRVFVRRQPSRVEDDAGRAAHDGARSVEPHLGAHLRLHGADQRRRGISQARRRGSDAERLHGARHGGGARNAAARILSRYALELFRLDGRRRASDRAHLGQRLDAYLREHVLQPLGMTDTSFVIAKKRAKRFAANYQRLADDSLKLVDDPGKSIYATARSSPVAAGSCRRPTTTSGLPR